ncbi:DMT family transporter [Proteiniclasticum ruminis]|uniref:DMT family transporter n=1 Tax=Proteiniclasticum ruminis TaxID=398199 RepID=UPI0028AF0128|nr:DMT family transporter [Proteiniclasticum ruminis]
MFEGLSAGLLWGLDTVILGIALSRAPFLTTEQAIFLSPFVSTFVHDFFSSVWMLILMGVKKEFRNVLRALRSRSGKFIVLAALMGGPLGMTGYVLSIKYIGAAYTAIISSLFPAVGALFSYLFLKEKMKPYQLVGLFVSIGGVIALGYTPGGSEIENALLGFFFAFLCVIGWAVEAVIIAYGLKDPDISDEHALQIRQLTSTLFYAFIILPVLGGWGLSMEVFRGSTVFLILLSAFFGTASYLFYYKAIHKIGASKAMALNITYCAWAIVFGFFILQETVGWLDIVFAAVIVFGSILAASDLRDLVSGSRKELKEERKNA